MLRRPSYMTEKFISQFPNTYNDIIVQTLFPSEMGVTVATVLISLFLSFIYLIVYSRYTCYIVDTKT